MWFLLSTSNPGIYHLWLNYIFLALSVDLFTNPSKTVEWSEGRPTVLPLQSMIHHISHYSYAPLMHKSNTKTSRIAAESQVIPTDH